MYTVHITWGGNKMLCDFKQKIYQGHRHKDRVLFKWIS